jgi:hypothetical protein
MVFLSVKTLCAQMMRDTLLFKVVSRLFSRLHDAVICPYPGEMPWSCEIQAVPRGDHARQARRKSLIHCEHTGRRIRNHNVCKFSIALRLILVSFPAWVWMFPQQVYGAIFCSNSNRFYFVKETSLSSLVKPFRLDPWMAGHLLIPRVVLILVNGSRLKTHRNSSRKKPAYALKVSCSAGQSGLRRTEPLLLDWQSLPLFR